MTPDLFEKKRIIVCCGSGGVGKTTTAAALALEAAVMGKKAIVLTIDPAKRLATALGLDSLDYQPRKIPLSNAEGSLYAMMLDTKRTFDRLIEKYTKNPEARQAIFKNALYQNLSNMITGSQEYMAMEKLYELAQEETYDVLILDTPPTRHALDFLDAPRKMMRLTENSLLKWFLKPGFFSGRLGMGIIEKGAEKILSAFDRLAGVGFLKDLSEMLILMRSLLGGFQERAKAVEELLRKKDVGFLLITSPASVAVQDSFYFYRKIQESELPFLGFVVNRVHRSGGSRQVGSLHSLSSELQHKLRDYLKEYERLAVRDEKAVALLKKLGGSKIVCETVPLFSKDVHDLEGLRHINSALFHSEKL